MLNFVWRVIFTRCRIHHISIDGTASPHTHMGLRVALYVGKVRLPPCSPITVHIDPWKPKEGTSPLAERACTTGALVQQSDRRQPAQPERPTTIVATRPPPKRSKDTHIYHTHAITRDEDKFRSGYPTAHHASSSWPGQPALNFFIQHQQHVYLHYPVHWCPQHSRLQGLH